MLGESEARKALAAVKSQTVVVVDTRQTGNAQEYLVHDRKWAAGGVRIEPQGKDSSCPVVVLVPPGTDPQTLKVVSHPFRHMPLVVLRSGTGSELYHADTLVPDSPPPARLTTLRLHDRGQKDKPFEVHGCDLPHTVHARLPADPSASVVYVEGKHPLESLPPGQWFRVPLLGRPVSLTIDVGLSGSSRTESWSLTAAIDHQVDRQGNPVGHPCLPLAGGLEPTPLNRLIVVFDRTCPDAGLWDRARQLAKGGQSQGVSYGPNIGNTDTGPLLGELNAGIRQGLARGLREALAGSHTKVQMVWFADVPTEGLVTPEGLILPQNSVGRSAALLPPERVAGELGRLPYSPGLDLWDPLDLALTHAVEIARHDRGAAILVVGNSPPHMPHRPFNPFWRVIQREFGVPSGFRRLGCEDPTRRSSLWDFEKVLDEVDQTGIRIRYLFLGGHETPEWARVAGDRFRRVQEVVREVLNMYLPVIEAEALEDGVAAGVAEAVSSLRAEVSRVQLSHHQEAQ